VADTTACATAVGPQSRLLLDTTAPHDRDAQTSAAFQAARETLVDGALLLACTQRVERLEALGADTMADQARVRCCLTHPLPATVATAPAP
jgi:hypothetical protein